MDEETSIHTPNDRDSRGQSRPTYWYPVGIMSLWTANEYQTTSTHVALIRVHRITTPLSGLLVVLLRVAE